MQRVIFHIDVNSAFLSWSAVKLLRDGWKQDIREIPSVVSGNPNDRRSIVTAKSVPAKKLGINTAEPVSMALRKCPDLVIVGGDWEWYKHCSAEFIAICRTYSPVLEQFSIDECWLDMTEALGRRDPVKMAYQLKNQVKERLGFTVNVGVGSNKLLAKMASDFEKPDKVHTLWSSEVEQKMWPLGVRDLLWVGKKTEERLTAYGIRTIGQLARLGMGSLVRLVGNKFAQQLHANANGVDDSPVLTDYGEAKSYSAERTFSRDITSPEELDRWLFKVAVEVAHRIRRDNFRAKEVSVFVKTSEFKVHSRQSQMEQATDITALILNAARAMIPTIWDGGTPLRQVGLGVGKLTHEDYFQMSLFGDEKLEYYREWDRKYDEAAEMREHDDRHYSRKKDAPLVFSYPSGEEALAAAKKAVKSRPNLTMGRSPLPDGTDCFKIYGEGKELEHHIVRK